ncbi:MAG TPA: hypothetical protein VLR88_05715, partial [Propionibacteriaceae bacterium]|nr:hypothetical protein [Propionibacteriaceae bacterium]
MPSVRKPSVHYAAPQVVDLDQLASIPGGMSEPVLAHAHVGTNGDPLGRINDFDARLRGGLGDQVDVAAMRLRDLDITAATDVSAVFARYRDTMAAQERD